MASSFPGALDSFTNPTASQPQNNPSHSQQHANANDALLALEAKVGVDGSAVATSHDYKIAQLEAAQHTHIFNETPTGDVDGVNATFTLAGTPVAGTLMLFYNGVLQRAGGNDYTLSWTTIVFVTPPEEGYLLACYLS